MEKRILILFIAVLISISVGVSFVNASIIHGTVYDLSLREMTNVQVAINSSPKQLMVAKNGTYSFEVPNGFYSIMAKQFQKNSTISFVDENITVNREGNYIIDLVLFPEIDSALDEPEPIDINENFLETNNSKSHSSIYITLGIIIIVLAAYYCIKKYIKTRKEKIFNEGNEDDELEKLIGLIRQEGNRTTQKEIRKQIPFSEAKISLMIAELEHKGIIDKIKKGRGNIIILKK